MLRFFLLLNLLSVYLYGIGPTISFHDAILQTIEQGEAVRIENQSVQAAKEAYVRDSGAFDPVFEANVTTDLDRTRLDSPVLFTGEKVNRTRSTTVTSSISKQFESGIVISPSISLIKRKNNISNEGETTLRAKSSVNFVIPILRGFGRGNIARAAKEFSYSHWAQTSFQRQYNIETIVANTATAYWNALASKKRLTIFQQGRQSALEFIDYIADYVEAGENAESTLKEAEANLSLRNERVFAAELDYIEAKQNLALAIGLDKNTQLSGIHPDDMLVDIVEFNLDDESIQQHVKEALDQRMDYRALKEGINSNEILKLRAQQNLLPSLDLNITLSYSGGPRSDNHYLKTFFSDPVGVNHNVGVGFSYPIGNQSARGEYLYRQALLRQSELSYQQFQKLITSEVVSALSSLYFQSLIGSSIYKRQQQLQIALNAKEDQLQSGEENITNVLSVQNALLNSKIELVNAERNYFINLINLRLATGSLVKCDPQSNTLRLNPQLLHL